MQEIRDQRHGWNIGVRTISRTERAIEHIDTQLFKHRGIELGTDSQICMGAIRNRPWTAVGESNANNSILCADKRFDLPTGRTIRQQCKPNATLKAFTKRAE